MKYLLAAIAILGIAVTGLVWSVLMISKDDGTGPQEYPDPWADDRRDN